MLILKKHILKTALLLSVIFTGACNDYLEVKPVDGIVREDFWQTKEQAESAVIGIYAGMLDPAYAEKLFLWGELRADMLVPNAGVRNDEMEVINGNILQTNNIVSWAPFYRVINFCNTVIELAPQAYAADPTFTEEQLNGYLGEAYALRALNYFYLVRSFGEVPLKLRATIDDTERFDLPKSSEAEVLDQIIADLEKAESLAIVSYGNEIMNKGRVTKYTVNAIQADVNLWKGDFAQTIAACDKVITSGQFGLVEGLNNPFWFQQLYGEGNSSEAIFELQFSPQRLNPFYSMLEPSLGRRFLAAPNVVERVFTMDLDDPLNVDIRLDASVRTSNNSIWKYLGLSLDQGRGTNDAHSNWIFYRYADILLMKAEALALTEGGGEEALRLINVVRDRANALSGTEKDVTPTNQTGLIEYILEERAREFAFEGKRWFDLLRIARRDDYARMDLLMEAVMENAPSDRQQTIMTKYRDRRSHFWPILEYELRTNKNLEQNPFYVQ